MKLQASTKRLVIRPLATADFQPWQDAYSNGRSKQNEWDISPMQTSELTKSEFKKLLKQLKTLRDDDKFYDFGIFLKTTGELIGRVSLMDVSRAVFQNAYLGYRIFNPHWKQGYGKEAVRGMLTFGFTELKLHRIEAGVAPGNRRSILLARSLKMRKEGLKKRALYLGGKWVDIVIYTATCEDLGIKFKGNLKALAPQRR